MICIVMRKIKCLVIFSVVLLVEVAAVVNELKHIKMREVVILWLLNRFLKPALKRF